MSDYLRVRGVELRYLLTWLLSHEGPATVAELIDRLRLLGFEVGGRPSKTVSDALRWEIGHGRVWPRGRGRYSAGEMPRATEYRIEKRVRSLRTRAEERTAVSLDCRSEAGTQVNGPERQPDPGRAATSP